MLKTTPAPVRQQLREGKSPATVERDLSLPSLKVSGYLDEGTGFRSWGYLQVCCKGTLDSRNPAPKDPSH